MENIERRRYYGLRVGDIVSPKAVDGKEWYKGLSEVVSLGMDNNSVDIKASDGTVTKWVAEWCDIVTKVEDKQRVNFFYDTDFCSDIDDLISSVLYLDKDEIESLPDNWEVKVELASLQPMFQVDMYYMVKAAMNDIDRFEERLPLDMDERQDKELEAAFAAGIDIEKINAAIPKLYYPNGEMAIITKKDLLDW